MKKFLLIAGILLLIACVLALAFAALQFMAYRHALDGSPAFYDRLHLRMWIFFAIGIVLAILGAVCMVLHFKK